MAFLDNSGDIILDAVLTDAGRQRMARGEFRIVKYAFGDEEINYELFNSNHPSGSAYADLSIMQTPILEAFTNNTSTMQSRLVTISRNNILYLPVFRINELAGPDADRNQSRTALTTFDYRGFYLLADSTSQGAGAAWNHAPKSGVLPYDPQSQPVQSWNRRIEIDQGMITFGDPSIQTEMPADLIETAWLVRMDHRLMRLRGHNENANEGQRYRTQFANSFVDDDAIATYYITSDSNTVLGPREGQHRQNLDGLPVDDQNFIAARAREVFYSDGTTVNNGPIGNKLKIVPVPSLHVQQSDSLFDELGTSKTEAIRLSTAGDDPGHSQWASYKYIDTIINVVGVTTGASIDVPIRLIKKKS